MKYCEWHKLRLKGLDKYMGIGLPAAVIMVDYMQPLAQETLQQKLRADFSHF